MNGDLERSASSAVPRTAAMGDRRPPGTIRRCAGWVFVFALVIRLAWCTLATVTPISDCAGYNALARNLLQTGRFHYARGYAWRTPAYPGFLAGVYAVLGYDVRLAPARDHNHFLDPRRHGLFDNVLNKGLVHEREHLLGRRLGRRKKPGPQACGRKNRFCYLLVHDALLAAILSNCP